MRIVMLCGDGRSSRIMFHGLSGLFDIACVAVEKSVPAAAVIRRRARRLGWWKVAGQLSFIGLNKLFARIDGRSIDAIMRSHDLDGRPIPENVVLRVDSINDAQVVEMLHRVQPEAIVVNGTRIIAKTVLDSIEVPFINTHMGITPRYRGVHGGYWALATGDTENCGVTVHMVDEGIDTGGVIRQARIQPGPGDSFNTYPVHQIARAIPLMRATLEDVRADRLTTRAGVLPSRLWYHPTLWFYLKTWWQRGVR